MNKLNVKPEEIITLNDYPVHSLKVLNEYVEKCKSKQLIDFIPVIEKDIMKTFFDKQTLEKFKEFEKTHPSAKYFMLDGSHRTTALTINNAPIEIITYRNDKDIANSKNYWAGEVFDKSPLTLSLEENCNILNNHFKKKTYFFTVLEKTEKMRFEGYLKNIKI